MGLADDRKSVNLMTVHVSKSVTVHEVSNSLRQKESYLKSLRVVIMLGIV